MSKQSYNKLKICGIHKYMIMVHLLGLKVTILIHVTTKK